MRRRTSREDKVEFLSDSDIREDADDWFGHRDLAQVAFRALMNVEPPFNIGIFGSWGTGKTSLMNLLRSKLGQRGVSCVTLDAWKYSAHDMRRAFLVKVADEIAPSKVQELQARLYHDVQETLPAGVELEWRKLLSGLLVWMTRLFVRVFAPFVVISILLCTMLWLARLVGVLESSKSILEAYRELLLIPLLLAVASAIGEFARIQVVRVSRARVDSTEVFERIFNEVVDGVKGDRFVVFVDNLDRLTGDKMIEALETIKTFLNNPKCIYVVACDDAVVRSVVSRSQRVPGADAPDTDEGRQRAGEEYLDKFFQFSIRIPPYQEGDIVDFAKDQFRKTVLSDELSGVGIDLDRFLTVLLPAGTRSPRKVKKLLNEYIALYRAAEQRQKLPDRGLWANMLTGQPLFLAKMVVLRSEFPEFYDDLSRNSRLLEHMDRVLVGDWDSLESHQLALCDRYFAKNSEDKTVDWSTPEPRHAALMLYLRKTRRVTVHDTLPFLSLSQDLVRRELADEHLAAVRECLASDDLEAAREMLMAAQSDDYVYHLVQFMRQSVAGMKGIEQTNGVRVLCGLLEDVPEKLRPALAEELAGLLAGQDLGKFLPTEVFGALEYAGAHPTTDEIVQYYIDTLGLPDDPASQIALRACFGHGRLLERTQQLQYVQTWLDRALSADTPSGTHKLGDFLTSEFASWEHDDSVLSTFFSTSYFRYGVQRLSGAFAVPPGEPLDAPQRLKLRSAVRRLAPLAAREEGDAFWQSVLDSLQSPSTDAKQVGLDMIDWADLADIPQARADALIAVLMTAFDEVGPTEDKRRVLSYALRFRDGAGEDERHNLDSILQEALVRWSPDEVWALVQPQLGDTSAALPEICHKTLFSRIADMVGPRDDMIKLLRAYLAILPDEERGELGDLLDALLGSGRRNAVEVAAETVQQHFGYFDHEQGLNLLKRLRECGKSLDVLDKHLALYPLVELVKNADPAPLRDGIGGDLAELITSGDDRAMKVGVRHYRPYVDRQTAGHRASVTRDLIRHLDANLHRIDNTFASLIQLAIQEAWGEKVGNEGRTQLARLLVDLMQPSRTQEQRLLGAKAILEWDRLPRGTATELTEQIETLIAGETSSDALGKAGIEARDHVRELAATRPRVRKPSRLEVLGILESGQKGEFSDSREGPWKPPVGCDPLYPQWPALGSASWIWIKDKPTDAKAQEGQTVWHRLDVSVGRPTSGLFNALLFLRVDDAVKLYINGEDAGEARGFSDPIELDLSRFLRQGDNGVEMEIVNDRNTPDATGLTNPSGIIYRLEIA